MINREQADQLIKEREALLIFFTAAGCNVCLAVKPRIIELAARHHVPILLISTDEQIEFSAQRLVFTVPTVLLFYQGREIGRESRFINFDQLARTLSQIGS